MRVQVPNSKDLASDSRVWFRVYNSSSKYELPQELRPVPQAGSSSSLRDPDEYEQNRGFGSASLQLDCLMFRVHTNVSDPMNGVIDLIYRRAQNDSRGVRCMAFFMQNTVAAQFGAHLPDVDQHPVALALEFMLLCSICSVGQTCVSVTCHPKIGNPSCGSVASIGPL